MYLNILIAVTDVNTNRPLFPLAYAVVDTENDNNWFSFCNLLCEVINEYMLS